MYAFQEKYTSTPITLRLVQISFVRTSNGVPKLPKDFFTADLPVKRLYFRDIKLYSIEKNAFNIKQFANLTTLELIRMPIMSISEGIFNGLSNLRFLTLDHLQIHRIGSNILKPLPKLEMVTIQYCGEKKITVDNLFGCVSLNYLNKVTIEYCNLRDTITEKTFTGLRNITELKLRHNQIAQIEPRSFDIPMKTLKLLLLERNELKFIPGDLFQVGHTTNSAMSINIGGNPWHCGCNMENFRQFIQKGTHLIISPVFCKTPPNCSRKYLLSCKYFCKKSTKLIPMFEPIKSEPMQEIKMGNDIQLLNNDSISVKCTLTRDQIPYRLKPMVHLSKPDAVQPIHNRNGKIIVDSKYFPKHFSLIGFQESINNNDKRVSNCWINEIDREAKKVIIKSEPEPNQVYQFCWLKNRSNFILPLRCRAFYSFARKDEDDFWLTIEHMPIVFTILGFSAILAPLIGVSIACILAKLFPRKIWARRPIQSIVTPLTPREMEGVKRVRLVLLIVLNTCFKLL